MVKIENEDILYRDDNPERLAIQYLLVKPDHTTYHAEIPYNLFNAKRIVGYDGIFGRSVSEYFILSYLEDHFEPYHTPEIRLHVLYPFTVEEMHS